MSLKDSKLPRTTDFQSQYQSIGPADLEEDTVAFFRRNKGFVVWISAACLLILGVTICGALEHTQAKKIPAYNNGSHSFLPTVILISLDGTVNDDLDLHVTPTLSQMAKKGSRAQHMIPPFPPITFPSHWSLVTGLYPESHGVVGNYFYDPVLNDSFDGKNPKYSTDEKWWGGEPIWITSVKQKVKSGVIMWPGCSTTFQGQRPTYLVPFNNFVTFDEKVDQVFDWLDLPVEDRPQFIGLYVPQIDQAGHRYGPYANETIKELKRADASIGRMLEGIKQRNLTHIVNTVVVSDHGMSETDKDRLIFYDTYLTQEESSLIWKLEDSPILGIRVRPEIEDQEAAIETLYQAFKRIQAHHPQFDVYKRQDVPLRFHFSHHHRIPPLIVLPEPGWNLVTHQEYDPTQGEQFIPRGTHGYDNRSPQSRAIFVAQGPDFPSNRTIKPFWNVELFNILARILHLNPTINNGTLNGHLHLSD